ncbi:MAG TPA: TIGR03067 domain-containing protein [Tepidisphaeraceae bacterium]|nr:TIGR03067 domain-containing protein [Tepidisphaeraceae bacterium]
MSRVLKIASLIASIGLCVASASAQDSLEGQWSCVSAIVNGKPLSDSKVSRLRLTLTRERYKTEESSEVLFDSTYSIDRTTTPKQITMIGTEGDLAGKEAQGIYAIDGETLRICYTMPGHARPKAFESNPGSEAYLIVWKRQKPEAK